MTPLRQRMLEDLSRYNYAPRTRQTYVAQIAKLAKHFGVSPDQLTREQVQQYQDLLTGQSVSWLPQAVAAMQFLYNKTLSAIGRLRTRGGGKPNAFRWHCPLKRSRDYWPPSNRPRRECC